MTNTQLPMTKGGEVMSNTLIEVKDLMKIYGEEDAEVRALNGVNATVHQGEFVAVMGPSGSGKSTLMNILGCLDRPTAGAYILDGHDVSDLSKNELSTVRNQKIGFVFQSFNLLPRLSALSNVMLPLLYNDAEDLSRDERKEQQRVAIARALVNRPPLILADEPTGNLDSVASVEIMDLLHDLHGKSATIVMVTHELDIAQHAQRVICVKDGHVISEGRDGHSPCLDRKILMGEAA